MRRLPRPPRRRPKWQLVGITMAGSACEFIAWFAIGFAALTTANATNTGGTWGALLWLTAFATVIGAGTYGMRYGARAVRAIRRGRTPERHRRNQSARNPSRRFRRG